MNLSEDLKLKILGCVDAQHNCALTRSALKAAQDELRKAIEAYAHQWSWVCKEMEDKFGSPPWFVTIGTTTYILSKSSMGDITVDNPLPINVKKIEIRR